MIESQMCSSSALKQKYSRYICLAALSCLLLTAFIIRILNISHGVSVHPDERHIMMVTEKLSLADPNPHFFAYGSFPFYLLWGISNFLGVFSASLTGYDGLFLVGRTISVLFGVLSGLLTFCLARKIYNNSATAFLATTLLLFNVFHIQLSRFYAFDILLTALNIAALIFIVNIYTCKNRWSDYIFSGLLIGLSLATKISALSLFAPLLTAMAFSYLNKSSEKFANYLLKLLSCLIVSIIIFILVEPYAILDYKTFLANNKEQISMVKGLWRPPYTVQYAETAPWFYHLNQIFNYTTGWVISSLGVIGIISVAAKKFTNIKSQEIILLSWIIPVFLLVASYQVKFPRYLINLYPVFLIFSARCLYDISTLLKERFKLKPLTAFAPLFALVIFSVLKAIAFISIYSTEHSYIQSSRWIFANVEDGARILSGHWDDTLPAHLPGLDPARYKRDNPRSDLPLYEADTPAKLDIITSRVAAGDYIIFPTQRLTGSLTRLPAEFPYTDAFFRLLYSDRLGYEMVQTFKERPRLGPYEINDDLADESLSVYDHPKVTIFKNTERFTAEELKARILNPHAHEPLITRDEILLRDSDTKVIAEKKSSSILSFIIWYLTLQLLAVLAFPVIEKILPHAADLGYGVSKVLGIFIFGYLSWMLPSLGLFPSNQITNIWLVMVLILIHLKMTGGLRSYWKEKTIRLKNHIITTELLFAGMFSLFTMARVFNPEIFWGEKPMDFTLLNFFIRSESLPPQDPWSAGTGMRYYYLGTYFFSSLLKLTCIDPAIGYNLATSTLPALLVTALYSLLLTLTQIPVLAILTALAICLVGNPELLNLITILRKGVNFDTYWASTRLFNSGGITEYPVWSFLFADLHAHVIAIPFTVLLLVLGISLTRKTPSQFTPAVIAHRVMYAAVLGSLFALNSWDFIVYSAATLGFILIRPARERLGIKGTLFYLVTLLLEYLLILTTAFLFILPFYLSAKPDSGFSWGWNHKHEYNTMSQFSRHLGFWIALLIYGLFVNIVLSVRRKKIILKPNFSKMALLSLTILPIIFVATLEIAGISGFSFSLVECCILILALLNISLLAFYDIPLSKRLPVVLIFISIYLVIISDSIFIIDRNNTVFKFYNSIWILLSVASICFLKECFNKKLFRYDTLILAFPFLVLSLGLLGTIFNFYVTTSFRRTNTPTLTLDGSIYLKYQNSDEYNLIQWLNSNVVGTPRIAEAHGDAYGPFARIAMNTGIPALLGWEHHIKQRGTSPQELENRKSALNQIYSNPSAEVAESFIDKYKINLIVVGDLERKTYPGMGIKKFTARPDIFVPLFSSGETNLYITRRRLTGTSYLKFLKFSWENN